MSWCNLIILLFISSCIRCWVKNKRDLCMKSNAKSVHKSSFGPIDLIRPNSSSLVSFVQWTCWNQSHLSHTTVCHSTWMEATLRQLQFYKYPSINLIGYKKNSNVHIGITHLWWILACHPIPSPSFLLWLWFGLLTFDALQTHISNSYPYRFSRFVRVSTKNLYGIEISLSRKFEPIMYRIWRLSSIEWSRKSVRWW